MVALRESGIDRKSSPTGTPADRSGSPCTSPYRPVAHRFSGPPQWRFPGRYLHRARDAGTAYRGPGQRVRPPRRHVPRARRYPHSAETAISVHLDPRQGRGGLAVVEFRAGKLATPASDTPDRVRDDNAPGLLHDDEGLLAPWARSGPSAEIPTIEMPPHFKIWRREHEGIRLSELTSGSRISPSSLCLSIALFPILPSPCLLCRNPRR